MQEQLWNLKDKKGRIYGPFTTSKIMNLIQKGALEGEELLSPENTQRWVEISKYPEFYDVILETLQQGKKELTAAEIAKEFAAPKSSPTEAAKESEVLIPAAKKRGTVVDETVSVKITANTPPEKSTQPSLQASARDSSLPKTENKKEKNETPILDLKPKQEIQKKSNHRIFLILITLIVGAILAALLFLDTNHQKTLSEKIHLRVPLKKKQSLEGSVLQKNLQQALLEFQKDEFEGYFKAQSILVSVLESNPKTVEAISLLCLTHRELWPFAYKDSQDLQALTSLVQMAQKENAMDVHGATCRAVQSLLVGTETVATATLQTVLTEFPTAAVFYEMKADLLRKEGQKNPAIAYYQKTQNLWPKWIKPFFEEASLRSEIQDYSNAVRIFKTILEVQPSHDKSKIEMGIIEISHFSNPRGLDYLQLGLKNEKIPSSLQVRGYFALANYYLKSDPQLALKYAQKAYSLDPKNMALRNTILSLGGENALTEVKSQDSQLMVVAESYFRNKNYLAAQAEYKTAFEVNPNNALAALKASESLWNLNQTQEAIEWAKKSIRADSKFIEAYIQLADYHAQKYDFKAAADYLSKAQAEGTSNYLVFRGFALFELRRQNIPSAIQRAEQALKLYDSDVESLIVLSQCYLLQRQYDKAFQYSAKAIQLDANNIKAHEVYAQAILGLRGIHPASQYLGEKVATFPNQSDYRVALGSLYGKDERYMDAIQILEQAVEFDPNNYRGHMSLSKAYLGLNQTNKAIKSILKAAALDPTNAEPLYELGVVYMKDAKTQTKALKNFQNVIAINPRFPKAHFMAGQAALLSGNKKQALDYAESEKKLNPSLADAYILTADILFSDGNYARASNELRRAVQLRPQDSQLYVQLARTHRLLGQLDAASSMLRVAISKESGNAEIYKEQGLVFEKQGLNDFAVSSFNRYLEIKPNAEDRREIQNKISTLISGGT